MKIEHIQLFCEVVESGSISQAAKNGFISQQGLSMAMKQIESELGIGLFQRSNKGVKLTEDGEKFYCCCDAMMKLYNNFLFDIHDAGDSNTFNVYITTTLYKLFSVLNKAPFMKNHNWYFSYIERSADEVVRMINENKGIALFSVHHASKYNILNKLNGNLRTYNIGSEEKIVCVCHKDSILLQQASEAERRLCMKNMKCVISSSMHDLNLDYNKARKTISVPDLVSHKEFLQQQDFYSLMNYNMYRLHFNPTEYIAFHERRMRKKIQYYAVFNLPPSEANALLEKELVNYLEEMLHNVDEL
ncbi:MAG: LysR family transcriptional regulator [Peptococcaceae bacterium]|nr:LysR family transcriptional regulator [Peptococcaceae bacterium]MBQ2837416.1 LysR family transcriptional regulator [Peptococcaceae bacterium]MBQ3206264.1 LysR family transcriptional regulator [Peptococcaceae bacterium]MBQ6853005.1 LysR family transcriptional regulator [Peptococcaceae bacterium]MBR2008490.1 LysR family transcriptional regulator [Peptococcaceae bacterium]